MSLEDLLSVTVTTATKSERTLEQSPSIMTVFTRADIDRLGVDNLVDLLQYVPGFYEVSAQLGRNYSIRGIHAASAQHFVILLDGLPMSDFLTSTVSPALFRLGHVERVEIIRGPGSAIYGASALMGVVNVITRTGKQGRLRAAVQLGSNLQLGASLSRGLDLGKHGTLLFAGNLWGAAGTRFDVDGSEDALLPRIAMPIYDGLQAGENLTSPRRTTPVRVNRYGPSFNLLARYRRPDSWELKAFAARSHQYLQRTYVQSLVDAAEAIEPPQYVVNLLAVDLKRRFAVGKNGRFGAITFRPAVTFYSHDMRSQRIAREFFDVEDIRENPDNDQHAVTYRWSGNDLRLIGSLDYQVDLPDAWIFRDSKLFVGLQASYSVAFDYRQNRCFVDRDGRWTTPGPYASEADLHCTSDLLFDEGLTVDDYGNVTVEDSGHLGNGDEWVVGPAVQLSTFLPAEIGLVLGLRVDYNPDFDVQLSRRAAVVAPLPLGLYTKLQYSTAFIYPAFLYRMGNSKSHYIGNPAIKPQSIDSLELLLGFKRNPVRVELNGYYNRIDGFITYDLARNAQTGNFQFSNQGDLQIVGVELDAHAKLLEGRLAFDLYSAFARPLSSTDEDFLFEGRLGGPTKSPQLMAGVVASGTPYRSSRLAVNLTASFQYADAVQSATPPESRFGHADGLAGIPGTDGRSYTSLRLADYQTRTLLLNASAAVQLDRRWRLGITAYNLLDRRHYRPGSLRVPLLLDGLKVLGQLSLTY